MGDGRCHHDQLFRDVYSDPAEAAALFQELLPVELGEQIDWGTLRSAPTAATDVLLGDGFGDLVYEVALKGGGDFVLLLMMEHQSTPIALMALRMQYYMVHRWMREWKSNPGLQMLTPIVPMVMYQGNERWSGPTELAELFRVPEGLWDVLRPLLPRFRFVLHDLSKVGDGQMPGRAYGRMAQALMKNQGRRDLWHTMMGWTELSDAVVANNGPRALVRLLLYTAHVNKEERDETWWAWLGERREDVMRTWKSAAEELIERGRVEGLGEGLTKGLDKGAAVALEQVLEVRFGDVPERVQAVVRRASGAECRAWLGRAVLAESFEEIFELPPVPQA